MKSTNLIVLVLGLLILNFAGCATVETVSNVKPGSPIFFSGSRLNVNAMADRELAAKKFKVSPPTYPLLDLPASFLLDVLISPITGSVALYELIFE